LINGRWRKEAGKKQESTMAQLEKDRTRRQNGKVMYTAKIHTTGGREAGASGNSDGRLDVRLSPPGTVRIGTNPEQLVAAGWSDCFESAIGLAASKRKIALPADLGIDAEVDLHLADSRYFLSTGLNCSLPGIEREVVKALVEEADQLGHTRATLRLRPIWSEPNQLFGC
jgi:lipoyl-dependent peroxiredoxin